MKSKQNIEIITRNDFCISCGACSHICPFNNIYIVYNAYKGKWEPNLREPEICNKCNGEKNCLSVCPNFNVDYMKLANSQKNNLFGEIKDIFCGYSKDYDVRFNSSSGGFIRELCKELLHSKVIDGIISICHQSDMDFKAEIITDIDKMPNSIYHNINYEDAFNLILKNEGKYLLIGLPCQITSIELLLRKNVFLNLNDRIYAKVALICGYTFDRVNVEAFAYYHNFQIKGISYREQGRFRKTRIYNNEKSLLFDVYNPKKYSEKINNLLMMDRYLCQKGCLFCVDHIGYCADIIVGDAWLKRYSSDRNGTNLIILRNMKAYDIFSKVHNCSFEKGSVDDIIESQGYEYSLGTIGEAFKDLYRTRNVFYPKHLRTTNKEDLRVYNLSFIEVFKAEKLKPIIKKRFFLIAKIIYWIIDFFQLCKKKIFNKLRLLK